LPGMALLHNADTIGPSPKVSDNTALCNTGAMPADGVIKQCIFFNRDFGKV